MIEQVMDKRAARTLTSRIQVAAEELWKLLEEAHEGKAWRALGYETWAEYVTEELGMSARRSYRLLDQGAVIKELGAVSGVSHASQTTVLVSQREAAELKPVIEDVKAEVAQRIEAGEQPRQAVRSAVKTVRKPTRQTPCRRCDGSGVEPRGTESRSDCKHPPGRRIGDWCAECGGPARG